MSKTRSIVHHLILTLMAAGVFLIGAASSRCWYTGQETALNSAGIVRPPVVMDQTAPQLALTDLQGNPVSLADYAWQSGSGQQLGHLVPTLQGRNARVAGLLPGPRRTRLHHRCNRIGRTRRYRDRFCPAAWIDISGLAGPKAASRWMLSRTGICPVPTWLTSRAPCA